MGELPVHPLWDLLCRVRSLSFVARSGAGTGWDGQGIGTVEAREAGDGILTWHERGTWRREGSDRDIRFTNVYRWTLADGLLRLEYLRFGEANPVHLLDLARAGDREWQPASPHLCREDCYSAVLVVHDDRIVLRWEVAGPRKRETIEYEYR
jgi:hypothetical protein